MAMMMMMVPAMVVVVRGVPMMCTSFAFGLVYFLLFIVLADIMSLVWQFLLHLS